MAVYREITFLAEKFQIESLIVFICYKYYCIYYFHFINLYCESIINIFYIAIYNATRFELIFIM